MTQPIKACVGVKKYGIILVGMGVCCCLLMQGVLLIYVTSNGLEKV